MTILRGWKLPAVVAAVAVATAIPALSLSGGHPASSAYADALQQATTAAAAQPETTPNPSDFEYLRIAFPNGQVGEFWLSVDGTHDGLMHRPDLDPSNPDIPIPGCVNGKQPILRGDTNAPTGQTAACTPRPIFDSSLPSTSAGMLALLKSAAKGAPAEFAANTTGKRLQQLLEFTMLTKAQRLALLQAASQLPGLAAKSATTNGSGTSSVLIQWDTPGGTRAGMSVDGSTGQFVNSMGGSDTIQARGIVASVGKRST